MRPLWSRCVLAAVSGLAAALAFPPYDAWWLLPLAVAGLVVAVPPPGRSSGRATALVGLAYGLTFAGVLMSWISVIGPDVAVGLAVLEGSFYALLALGLRWVRHLPLWPLWGAVVFTGVDLLRGAVPWGGMPWGSLAFATADSPWAPAMTWVGTAGTGILVALAGTTLAWLVLEVAPGGRRRGVLVVLAPLAVAALTLPVVTVAWQPPAGDRATARVAAVQGNVPGEGMDAFSERRAVLDNHVRGTYQLAARVDAGETPRPDLVLWPENSTDIDPFEDPSVHDDIQGAVDAVGAPTLVGAMVRGPGERDVENQGIVWEPDTGPASHYAKRHPVPFGEYIPMREQLAQWFERLDQIPRDMVPGTLTGALELGGTTIGDVICFEVAYDDLVHDVVDDGARMLVVQTNNATYMDTGQVEQQFAIARLRAVETQRYVAVVATNGVSGLIAPDGSVLARLPVRSTATWEADVPQLTGLTPAVRWAAEITWGVGAAALLAALVGLALDGRRRRRTPAPTDGPTGDPIDRTASPESREAASVPSVRQTP